eukprot:gnl/TRDRNA2_/TRDRNA2_102603_c1_seq1.p1 gnl/TRDRNA2_/TRDRNA2_102603_c1~~gnl/TRDRNA2_/TRDRNA2_102603_c1_seq1.p1  ORF type:complete len:124 (-),score=4.07 gnl/TRDRNA2_/TRDRNA2_102603_c1_seq1:106-477(-)
MHWLLGLSIPITLLGWPLPAFWLIGGNCALPGHINPLLQSWAQKGVNAQYRMGSKHYQARISAFVPTGPQVIGATVMPRQMQVAVPADAVPGATLQFQTPEGQFVQATVPQGASPGSTFSVAY